MNLFFGGSKYSSAVLVRPPVRMAPAGQQIRKLFDGSLEAGGEEQLLRGQHALEKLIMMEVW